jgi:MFS family permease
MSDAPEPIPQESWLGEIAIFLASGVLAGILAALLPALRSMTLGAGIRTAVTVVALALLPAGLLTFFFRSFWRIWQSRKWQQKPALPALGLAIFVVSSAFATTLRLFTHHHALAGVTLSLGLGVMLLFGLVVALRLRHWHHERLSSALWIVFFASLAAAGAFASRRIGVSGSWLPDALAMLIASALISRAEWLRERIWRTTGAISFCGLLALGVSSSGRFEVRQGIARSSALYTFFLARNSDGIVGEKQDTDDVVEALPPKPH